jgi:hypothetical protein
VSRPALSVTEKRVRAACCLALAALALIIWSLVQPAPLAVIGAMTVGQVLGTLSLVLYLFAILNDLRPALKGLRDVAFEAAPAGESAKEAETKPG